jgi:hypothetical protein
MVSLTREQYSDHNPLYPADLVAHTEDLSRSVCGLYLYLSII